MLKRYDSPSAELIMLGTLDVISSSSVIIGGVGDDWFIDGGILG